MAQEFDVVKFSGKLFPDDGADSVENWLSRLAPRTAKVNGYMFRRWLKWMRENGGKYASLSPDELIELQKDSPNGYDLLDAIQRYVQGLDLRANSKSKAYSSLRSFFLHNRSALPNDPSYIIRSNKAPVKKKLTVEDFKKIILGSNECYAALLCSMFQGGMGVAEALHWSDNGYDDLVRELQDPYVKRIRIDIPGRKFEKNKKPFFTFIREDSIRFLRTWLMKRGDTPGSIFQNQFHEPVTENSLRKYWMRKTRRLGLIPKKGNNSGDRYGMNLHIIRTLFRSRWRVSGADIQAGEWMMGHESSLDALGYDTRPEQYPEYFEEQYDKAGSWLNIFSKDPSLVPRNEVNDLRKENEKLREELSKRDHRLSRVEDQMAEVIRELKAMKNGEN